MAVTSDKIVKTSPAPAPDPTPDPELTADGQPAPGTEPSVAMGGRRPCVAPGDFHVGYATPGSKVCSYHAMHYDSDGNRRDQ